MNLKTIKRLALSSALILSMAATSGTAIAQTETVNATLETSSAIDSVKTSDINFGEWLIQFAATTTPSLTLLNDGSNTVNVTGTVGASQVISVNAANQAEGGLTVETPAPSTLQLTASSFTDMPDAGLSLTTVSYNHAGGSGNIIASATPTPAVAITVAAGATPEPIALGGVVAITATPDDTNSPHTASFDVTFAY